MAEAFSLTYDCYELRDDVRHERWVFKALRELAAQGYIRVITCTAGRDDDGRELPACPTRYVLTDQGRAHFRLPLPVYDRD